MPTDQEAPSDRDVHDAARRRLAIALDVDDLVVAQRIARQVSGHVGIAKVGHELFSAVGPDAVGALVDEGLDVFLDLKLHDIPSTVERAARVLGSLGVSYLTFHAFGGRDMLRAGVAGLDDGASRAGLDPPSSLAVTVLTSDDDAPAHILPKRVMWALESGCDGIVCAVDDAREARNYGPRLVIVVPGIRPEGVDAHDQRRPATPTAAVEARADVLVVGRAITGAPDPEAAAAAICDEVAAALAAPAR